MKSVKSILFGSYAKMFVSMYFLLTLSGAILLSLPFSVADGQNIDFVDAIFVSISAISTTGLSPIDVGEVFTPFGQIILLLYLQIGGIGIMLLLAAFWIGSGKTIGFKQRTMIATEQNQTSMEGIFKLVILTITSVLIIELVSVVILGTYLMIAYSEVFTSPIDAYFNGLFMTISTFTNAGFDIESGNSYSAYVNDIYFQVHSMILMFIGAVGFWPMVEFREWISAKRHGEPYKISNLSKLLFKLHLYIWLFSSLAFFVLEYDYLELSDKSLPVKVANSLFMGLTTRNAGFTVYGDLTSLHAATIFMLMILMVIGSSPNSVGGGIRTTSVAVVFKTFWSYAIGREQVVIQKKAIKNDTIRKSSLIIMGAIVVILVATFIILIVEGDQFGLGHILFEVSSAFGTTGLSLGITGELHAISKIILVLVMFIGRVGVLALLLMVRNNQFDENKIRYPEGDIMVG